MIRKLPRPERDRIAADYGIAPEYITTVVHVANPAHGSAGTTPPWTPRETLTLWYKNVARARRLRAAREMQPPPAPEPLPAPVMATWGDE